MLRWLLVALAGYIIYRMFRNDIKAKLEQRNDDDARRYGAGEMARDPVCGTFVDMDNSITVREGDKRYFFCSYDCRDAFLKRLQNGESPESIQASSQREDSQDKEKNSETSADKNQRPGQ